MDERSSNQAEQIRSLKKKLVTADKQRTNLIQELSRERTSYTQLQGFPKITDIPVLARKTRKAASRRTSKGKKRPVSAGSARNISYQPVSNTSFNWKVEKLKQKQFATFGQA